MDIGCDSVPSSERIRAAACVWSVGELTRVDFQQTQTLSHRLTLTTSWGKKPGLGPSAQASQVDINLQILNFMFIFLLQAGFTALEVGVVRHKNVRNILIKNLMDAVAGACTNPPLLHFPNLPSLLRSL